VRRLRLREREAALARLRRHPRANLLLIDTVHGLGGSAAPGEARPEVLAALAGGEILGLASLQPTVAAEADLAPEVFALLLPHLASASSGLMKTESEVAERVWQALRRAGRRAVLDRIETGYALEPEWSRLVDPPPGAKVRPARPGDLDDLVEAARASLREEDRPDPFDGDPGGFRRWVAGRLPRATVAVFEGRPRFVGYADVQRREGHLLQGVYTWPAVRRRGLAAAGVSELCRRAFAAGAEHVQLAVVEGNGPAERLYERLGFRRFVRLRTVLFA
jgi:RimJ/RimL family protein N-acetyltransferase